MPESKKGVIYAVDKAEQYRTVNELFEKSKPSSAYYAFLMLSAIIIASGLLLNNMAIVIGGMLVAPVLTPLLVVGLGVAVGEMKAVRRAILLLAQSFFVIMAIGLLVAVFSGAPIEQHFFFLESAQNAILYFLVAVASGVAATFAWVRKEMFEALPGIAIAVSIVPPLSLVGIFLAKLDITDVRYFFLIFLFNFIGIIIGSIFVFTYLKFYQVQSRIEEIQKEEEKEKEEKKREKEIIS